MSMLPSNVLKCRAFKSKMLLIPQKWPAQWGHTFIAQGMGLLWPCSMGSKWALERKRKGWRRLRLDNGN